MNQQRARTYLRLIKNVKRRLSVRSLGKVVARSVYSAYDRWHPHQ